MKTVFGKISFAALLLAAIAAVLAIRAFAQATPTPTAGEKKFVLQFGTEKEYAEVKSQAEFDTALRALETNKGQYRVRFLHDAQAKPIDDYHPGPGGTSINTDKITTSEVARTEPAEESSAYDPHAVYSVSSNSKTDIQSVLDKFK